MAFEILIDTLRINSMIADDGVVFGGGSALNPDIDTNQLVFSNGFFNSPGDAQTSLFILRATSASDAPTELYLDGASSKLILQNNTSYFYNVKLLGRDGLGKTVAMVVDGAAKRGANASTVKVVGPPHTRIIQDEIGVGEMKFDVNISSGALRFYVVGKAGTPIRWIARVELSELNF
jgi:hypothetical protein